MMRRVSVIAVIVAWCCAGSATADGIAYTYDAQGRIATAVITIGATTKTIVYTYDDAGNLLIISVSQ